MEYHDPQNRDNFIKSILDEHGRAMMNFAYTYVKDWAATEDIVQDVLIKICDQRDTFQGRASLRTWLFSITANQCKDYLRKSYIKKVLPTGLRENRLPARQIPPEQQVEQKTSEKELARQILSLPFKYREIIILYYYEELSTSEISKMLGVRLPTVKSRLQRARQKLKSVLKEGEWHD